MPLFVLSRHLSLVSGSIALEALLIVEFDVHFKKRYINV